MFDLFEPQRVIIWHYVKECLIIYSKWHYSWSPFLPYSIILAYYVRSNANQKVVLLCVSIGASEWNFGSTFRFWTWLLSYTSYVKSIPNFNGWMGILTNISRKSYDTACGKRNLQEHPASLFFCEKYEMHIKYELWGI